MRNLHTVFHSGPTSCIPPSSAWGFLFLHILANTYYLCFFILTILIGVRWYFIVVLICISLMLSYYEHPFIHLLATWMSSLEKCLFMSSAHFWNWIICFGGHLGIYFHCRKGEKGESKTDKVTKGSNSWSLRGWKHRS